MATPMLNVPLADPAGSALTLLGEGGGFLGGFDGLLLPIVFVAIFYFVVLRPTAKQEKQRKARLAALKKHDQVVLTGGIFGRISSVQDHTCMVEIADKVKVKVFKKDIVDFQDSALEKLEKQAGDKKDDPKSEDKSSKDKDKDAKSEDAKSDDKKEERASA